MQIVVTNTFGRSLDPLKEIAGEHEDLRDWIRFLDEALFYVADPEATAFNLPMLERFLSDRLPSHFAFEDYVVFPMILELERDPLLRATIRDLKVDHASILMDARSLTTHFHRTMDGDTDVSDVELRAIAKRLGNALLRHSAKEDDIIAPLLRKHAGVFTLPDDLPLLPE